MAKLKDQPENPVPAEDDEWTGAARPDNFNADGSPISGQQTIERVLKECRTCLLAYSGGKDSRAAWTVLRHQFDRVVPFYMYRIPGLPYIEDMLKRDEDYFGAEILQVPAPDLFRTLKELIWQTPERCKVIEAADLPLLKYDDLGRLIREHYHLPKESFVATGVRAVDNIQRGMAVRKHGPINWARQSFWPVWDLKKADLLELLQREQVPLSIEYIWFGHSLGGIDYRYIGEIHDRSGKDWRVLSDWFPLAWLEVLRYRVVKDDLPFDKVKRSIPPLSKKSKAGYQPTPKDLKSFKPEPDPFKNVDYKDDFEQDSFREWEQLRLALKEAEQRPHTDRYYPTVDMPFGFPVLFRSPKQKNVFLAAMDWFSHSDYYLDGDWLMDQLGIQNAELPDPETLLVKQNPLKMNLDTPGKALALKQRVNTGDLPPVEEKLQTAYMQRAKKDMERFHLAVGTYYWFWIGFRSDQQEKDFLKAMGWPMQRFNQNVYVDGLELARMYHIALEPEHLANAVVRKEPKYMQLIDPELRAAYNS